MPPPPHPWSMRPVHCELIRLRIPFQGRFAHARSERSESETILVRLLDARSGAVGTGEILPRPYVTGEDLDSVFSTHAPALAASLLGSSWADASALLGWIERQLEEEQWGPALLGGFEGALLDLGEQLLGLATGAMLGEPRRSPPGRCVTMGFEVSTAELARRSRAAAIGGATAVKLKVGEAGDAERVAAVARALPAAVALRLDGNGAFRFEEAVALLEGCRGIAIQSLEQPLAPNEPELGEKLRALHGRSGVPLMADESVCTVHDARRWSGSGGYQWFNVRVGKAGGRVGAARVAAIGREAGLGLVCGTMVGETQVLDRASENLLAHTEALPYVEGIGQYRYLLAAAPVLRSPGDGRHAGFVLDPEVVEQCLVNRRSIGD